MLLMLFYPLAGGSMRSGWRDEVAGRHSARVAERTLELYGQQIREVEKKIVKQEKKLSKAQQSTGKTDGILANLDRLAKRKEELRLKVEALEIKYEDVTPHIIAGSFLEQDSDEDDIEALLLYG